MSEHGRWIGDLMQKPAWMKGADYGKLVAGWPKKNGKLFCVSCEKLDEHPVLLLADHIVPRARGGTDELSNLQPLCDTCNLKKGARPDNYWRNGKFYFDQKPNLTAFRQAQRSAGYDIVWDRKDYWSRPISSINGVLYTMVAVVGAGKTLAPVAVAAALNRVRLETDPAAPRIDRVLFLTKEKALQAQIVEALEHDIVKYGIYPAKPRILAVTSGAQLLNGAELENYDVAVACSQSLWSSEKHVKQGAIGGLDPDFQAKLAHFPLIIIDEPHFADEQALQLVSCANLSLTLGLTSSPIDAEGNEVKRFVLFSLYDYQQADTHDRSMKYISDDSAEFNDIVVSLSPEQSTVLVDGISNEQAGLADRHGENTWPVQAVVAEMLRTMADFDERNGKPSLQQAAPHRKNYSKECSFGLVYPLHVLIIAESRQRAREIRRMCNKQMNKRRDKYPISEGYVAEIVESDDDRAAELFKAEDDNDNYSPRKLDKDHPWLRYKNFKSFKEHKDGTGIGARILIRIHIGREGLNNPYCGLVALTCSFKSIVEGVQGVFGRQIRSPNVGNLYPPDYLDRCHVITHDAFNNKGPLLESLKYLCNMEDYLKEMTTLDQVIEGGDLADVTSIDQLSHLTRSEVLNIVGAVGRAKATGSDPDEKWLQATLNPSDNSKKAKAIHKMLSSVMSSPVNLKQQLHVHEIVESLPVVTNEIPSSTLTRTQIRDHIIKHNYPTKALAQFDAGDEVMYEVMKQFCLDRQNEFRPVASDLIKPTDFQSFRTRLFHKLRTSLRFDFGTNQKVRVEQAVNLGIRALLGAPPGVSVGKGSIYDRAPVLSMLIRPEYQKAILGHATHWLLKQGDCKNIALGLNVEPALVKDPEDDE